MAPRITVRPDENFSSIADHFGESHHDLFPNNPTTVALTVSDSTIILSPVLMHKITHNESNYHATG